MGHERDSCGDLSALAALADEARDAAREAAPALEASAAVRAAEAVNITLRGADAPLAAAEESLDEAQVSWTPCRTNNCATGSNAPLAVGAAALLRPGGDCPERTARARARPPQRAEPFGHGVRGVARLRRRARRGAGARPRRRRGDAQRAGLPQHDARVLGRAAAAFAVAQGRIDEALAQGEVAAERTREHPPASAGWTLASAHLAAGDPEPALETIEEFGWVDPRLSALDRLRTLDVTVRSLLATGRLDEAATWAASAREEEAGGRDQGTFGAVLAHIEASVALAQGEAARAASVAQEGPRRRRAWTPRCGPAAAGRWPARPSWRTGARTRPGRCCAPPPRAGRPRRRRLPRRGTANPAKAG